MASLIARRDGLSAIADLLDQLGWNAREAANARLTLCVAATPLKDVVAGALAMALADLGEYADDREFAPDIIAAVKAQLRTLETLMQLSPDIATGHDRPR